jgi:hypothetical protein
MNDMSREHVSLQLEMKRSSVPGEWVVDIGEGGNQKNLFHFFIEAETKEAALYELKTRLNRDYLSK